MVMVCPKCQGDVWDNRPKKASGEFKPNSPDFSCKNRDGCGWVQWPPKTKASPGGTSAPIAPPSAPQAQSTPLASDAAKIELFWDCFDRVLAGVKQRALTDLFHGEQICALTATMFIQRSKG